MKTIPPANAEATEAVAKPVPCKICGGPAEYDPRRWNGISPATDGSPNIGHAVYCGGKCQLPAAGGCPQFETEAEAIEDWNRRQSVCDRPPEGWQCSRPKGHDGPCAATAAPLNSTCKTCDGTGQVPAMVETATGLAACPYIGEPCPDCAAPPTAQPTPSATEVAKPVHNPDGLKPEQVGVGWRLLCVGEEQLMTDEFWMEGWFPNCSTPGRPLYDGYKFTMRRRTVASEKEGKLPVKTDHWCPPNPYKK